MEKERKRGAEREKPESFGVFGADESQLPEEVREGLLKKQKEFTDRVWELYNAGRPMYSREVLEHLQEQLEERPRRSKFILTGMEGERREVVVPMPARVHETWGEPCIEFDSLQRLVDPFPATWPCLEEGIYPLSIALCRRGELPDTSTDKLTATWETHIEELEGSETWRQLESTLSGTALPRRIDKMVAFGLGQLAPVLRPGRFADEGRRRSYRQHALVLSLARLLGQRTGVKVACYAQDPGYTRSCKEALALKGIAVVEPERGFLLVDEATLVMTVSPNVPVRQVVADMARPAAMLWGPVSPLDQESRGWITDKDGRWMSPHTTDPDSPRLREMVKGYTKLPFPDDQEHFGELAVYVRKDGDGKGAGYVAESRRP